MYTDLDSDTEDSIPQRVAVHGVYNGHLLWLHVLWLAHPRPLPHQGKLNNLFLFAVHCCSYYHVHPRRQDVTTSMVGLKNGHIRKNLTQNGEPQRNSWERRRRRLPCMFLL